MAKKVKTETIETTNVSTQEGESKMNKNNGNNGKLADAVTLTKEAFESLDASQLAELLNSPAGRRVSRERAIVKFVELVRTGRVKINTPAALTMITYNVKLSPEAFNALTNDQKADLVKEHTHKRRAGDMLIPEFVKKGLKLSAQEIVDLTMGRINIEGVAVGRKSGARKIAFSDDDISFE